MLADFSPEEHSVFFSPETRNRFPLYRRHRFPAEIIAHAVWLVLSH
ncbi:hypothetical protein HJB54_32440 [Rhizobium lentis]|nr:MULTISPECIES: hypothetical protein [Rhizobium]MBB4346160.1 transposase-like protein [Rhizobium leguminosarum]MBB6299278.1 transposase-like protein [Rhizobium leguminosarum]MBX5020914.1 hypothetical protein [Rhizobium lentis]MBX5100082.1 hypothetical protein [Rhizobium lentis]MBY3179970.1 hypothetical protein [Rhizobium leguminosarum]